MEYKENLKRLQFNFANSFLSEKTLNFGNRTVITSSLLILISLNFLSIKEIEFEGLTVGINITILTLVILLVNIYYYKQFEIAKEVDDNSFFVPEEYAKFEKKLPEIAKPFLEKIDLHNNQVLEIKNRLDSGIISLQEGEELENKLSENLKELEYWSQILENTTKAVITDGQKAKKFAELVNKYNLLNSLFPKRIYYLGLICILLRFTIDTVIIFKTQQEPCRYILEENFSFIEKIFEKNERK